MGVEDQPNSQQRWLKDRNDATGVEASLSQGNVTLSWQCSKRPNHLFSPLPFNISRCLQIAGWNDNRTKGYATWIYLYLHALPLILEKIIHSAHTVIGCREMPQFMSNSGRQWCYFNIWPKCLRFQTHYFTTKHSWGGGKITIFYF